MSITLVIPKGQGLGHPMFLPRANSRLTTSAQFNKGDKVEVAGFDFYVEEITHRLAPKDESVAPVTFVTIVPDFPDNEFNTDDYDKLMKQGFTP